MDNLSKEKKNRNNMRSRFLLWGLLLLLDALTVVASYYLGLFLRFDCNHSAIPSAFLGVFIRFIPIYYFFCVGIFIVCGLYTSLWQFASFSEVEKIALSSALSCIFHVTVTVLFYGKMPAAYYFVGAMLQFMCVTFTRFFYRFVLLVNSAYTNRKKAENRVMMIGAGAAGQVVLREILKARESNDNVVCIIDDDETKWGKQLNGVRILGGREHIMKAAKEYCVDKIIFAIPSATAENRRDILNICSETGCTLLQIPSVIQLVNGEVTLEKIKKVEIEDLLGREPIRINMNEVFESIRGKKILVTGGGGSIGSELCRQIASHEPKELIIFDIYENNAYDIQQELKKKYPSLDLVVLIGSVRDSRRIFGVFETYKPDIVYHAAAHKHVPLMEDSPCEAIKNNVIGTYKTAFAAMAHGTKRFVLISTDKAVNPTNIMGASKRLCEMVIQSFAKMIGEGRTDEIPQLFTHPVERIKEGVRNAKTEFVAVRFGNVLGSNGSVIPLFRKQIESGGPVTVTHPDIIRYFMTIPEAVSLVLQAGVYAHGGEIFVLDMGSPMKIADLAKNLIRLSGYTPDVDIKIEYTGLRPGEKLFEEKLMAEEGLRKTDNALIHIGSPIPFDEYSFIASLRAMMEEAYLNHEEAIIEYAKKTVDSFHPAGRNGTTEKPSAYRDQIRQVVGGLVP